MTPRQIDLARHALGLPNGRQQSYRNRFVAGPGHDDFRDWEQMVATGDAAARRSSMLPEDERYFMLTHKGAESALKPQEKLDPEDFPVTGVSPGEAPSLRIVGVAIKLPDGQMQTSPEGWRHHQVISALRMNGWTVEQIAQSEQGFVADDGSFLTRLQAYSVAERSGQLKRKPGGYGGHELFSEDLW